TDNAVYFQGALGYNNGVYLLNDMCAALYSNSSLGITARSINLADMEKHLTTDGIVARNTYVFSNTNTQYGNTYEYTNNRYYPNLYANQLGAGIDLANGATVTQPSLSGADPYNESSNGYDVVTTATSTKANKSVTVTRTGYNIAISELNYGDAASILSNSNYFWVASRYVNAFHVAYAYFGLRCAYTEMSGATVFDSNNYNYNGSNRLRPVVSPSSKLLDGTTDANGVWQLK
ncbi:MAG: hypothetical protein ACI4VQ_01165, partial [Clostridia bacterium]